MQGGPMLKKRLAALAAHVTEGGVLCDVGSDHALLPAHLLLAGTIKQAFITDLRPAPLARARETLKKAGALEKSFFFLCDGLRNVPPDLVTDIVIAGMGGETIAHILEESPWAKQKRLILQPMTKLPFLRAWLFENGYAWDEEAVSEGDKFYLIFTTRAGSMRPLTPVQREAGVLDCRDAAAKHYVAWKIKTLQKLSQTLRDASQPGSEYYGACARSLEEMLWEPQRRIIMPTVQEIYEYLDTVTPFSTESPWDNSGLLVGDPAQEVEKIVTAMDITKAALDYASEIGAQLLVVHHPVLFGPVKRFVAGDPAFELARRNLAAICVHTPLDISPKVGLNIWAYEHLKPVLHLGGILGTLEPSLPDGTGFGWVAKTAEPLPKKELASLLRRVFGVKTVHYSAMGPEAVQTLGYCSGAGGSMLEKALENGCDALLTGDVKHDRWVAAEWANIALFDIGHYGTEHMAADILGECLQKQFPNVQVESRPGPDPADVCWEEDAP